ncbi:hypothetical protein G6F46_009009 [Rhizopus delemar]|uniref:Tetratricopeptide repeat protein 1 n=2 Tax=Rhizopus TaxID=4842 RepID=A0A9P6YYG5_9FUNG|nr:hypothetical protein G6F55_006162 [Rhizopus delemar]KAG1627926.1 hypothetical protein G6F45_007294 [Rhizopus arrhizus]KAG1493565.1 hypothetical protein G6F54_008486 [Rhizopus delemar]KAG1507638.1 hypothetical protein G6F53_008799 [Rhizopus delemar]KAG1523259.1 hypothetical protein G6F52_005170 [Rhizopus delemar]
MAIIEELNIVEESNNANPPELEADEEGDIFYESEEYQQEELQKLMTEATEFKLKGNTHFGRGEYKQAIEQYEHALMTCPLSLAKERAVYFANIAACHMKQNEYKDAKDMCTQALKSDPTYSKALLRRAQANEKIGSYTAMSEALDDYKKLKAQANDQYTLKECTRAERELPIKIKVQMEKEKEEMMSKLKDVGNTILGKFGLSTDNFQFTQDPSGSGGYSVNFVNK